MAFGNNNKTLANYILTQGQNNTVSGVFSQVFGSTNTVSGTYSAVMGFNNNVNIANTSGFGVAIGASNNVSGIYGKALGYSLTVGSFNDTAVGQFNAFTVGSFDSWTDTDPLFQMGIGQSAVTAQNAFTILKNGKMSIGVHNTKPKIALEIIGTDGMKVPTGTTAERPATVDFGTLRYNTDIGRGEMYVNDANSDGVLGDAGWRAF